MDMDAQHQRYGFGVLTLSDKGARGEREDTSGRALMAMLGDKGYEPVAYALIPDDREVIVETLREWADELSVDLIITTGGTGLSPRDVTPEATREVLDKEVPGMAEAMRMASMRITPNGMLSRGLVGIRGRSLIINLPGSQKAARENLEVVLPVLDHALYKLKGGAADCGA